MSAKKVVIVTGAGSGIGAATARRFAADGFAVVLNGRTEAKLEKVAADLGGGEHLLVQPGDVSAQADVKQIIAATVDRFGGIDVLVNNAGVLVQGGVDEVTLEDWEKQMAINAGGMFQMIKAALPHLVKSRGSVVNVSSVSGLAGDWGLFSYNATKGAVSNITRALALDLAAKGVRVNAVAPSLTATEMTGGIMEDDAVMQRFMERLPMGRAADPAEVADVIAFLAGHDARFVNGVVLPVDGGLSASNGQPNLG
ncbi:2-(R)-hydroxypropyl-CoM dehydrogenase [Posidoniimonas corsicana]|uniref:2-(R)-hydroxypropyl-CoM dehydrogenase n=1 Tax=Posidoniimonas corsicana TaxID=1938618 RepID=A0A5C5UXR7_9BACT|nr:SDR family oxidoreductase [Posidoniimonas corsicana]TWT30443.1 2-(R)-hydroxypropyl-CoM dehydrogenase [Posidoniimonas corsicana]